MEAKTCLLGNETFETEDGNRTVCDECRNKTLLENTALVHWTGRRVWNSYPYLRVNLNREEVESGSTYGALIGIGRWNPSLGKLSTHLPYWILSVLQDDVARSNFGVYIPPKTLTSKANSDNVKEKAKTFTHNEWVRNWGEEGIPWKEEEVPKVSTQYNTFEDIFNDSQLFETEKLIFLLHYRDGIPLNQLAIREGLHPSFVYRHYRSGLSMLRSKARGKTCLASTSTR
jgi:hypothetical protein